MNDDLRVYMAGEYKRAPWKIGNGTVIYLITPAELKTLPGGTVLTSITGGQATIGRDYIDGDTRGGFLAYGLPAREEKPDA